MRRLILLLCILWALPLCAEAAETTLMMVTDLHYIDPQFYEGSDLLERSAAIGDGKMPHRSDVLLAALVQQTLARMPDALIIAGDISYNGEVLSHRALSDALAPLHEAGIQLLVIPGNHDINNANAFDYSSGKAKAIHSIPVSRYEKYYGAYGPLQAFSRDEASFGYAVRLREDLRVLMIDAGVFEPFAEAFGYVRPATQDWIRAVLDEAAASGAQVISVTHQSLLPHSETQMSDYMIINWQEVAALLRGGGVRLNLSGHLHIQDIRTDNGLTCAALSALSNYPNQYALITIDGDGAIDYQTHALDARFLPEGFAEEAADFFYEASFGKALARIEGDIPDAQREAMADWAARINRHYYGGTVAEVRDAARRDENYARWLAQPEGATWRGYLLEMLEAEGPEMTTLSLPPFHAGA